MPEKSKEKSGKKEGRKLRIKKSHLYTTIVIIGILILAGVLIYFKSYYHPGVTNGVSESLAKCIGQDSHVYVQLGCSHCADQEAMFGSNWKYLTSTDCYYDPQTCISTNITGTPTWIINGQKYLGTQSIETLKQLTGC